MRLRCYCCGEEIIVGPIALLTMTTDDAVDRVFIFIPDHVEHADDPKVTLMVIPIK